MSVEEPVGEPKVTHRILRFPNFWKRFRTDKAVVVSSGPLPTPEQLPPKMPPEIKAEELRRIQTDAGVGSHAARTAAGMQMAQDRADERDAAMGGGQQKPEGSK